MKTFEAYDLDKIANAMEDKRTEIEVKSVAAKFFSRVWNLAYKVGDEFTCSNRINVEYMPETLTGLPKMRFTAHEYDRDSVWFVLTLWVRAEFNQVSQARIETKGTTFTVECCNGMVQPDFAAMVAGGTASDDFVSLSTVSARVPREQGIGTDYGSLSRRLRSFEYAAGCTKAQTTEV